MTPETLLQRAQREGTPLIDGDQAMFVWAGESAPALLGDFNNWAWLGRQPMRFTETAPGVWTATLTLPQDAYIEYFLTFTPEDDSSPRVPDPFNKRRVSNGLGKFNHYFSMPVYKPTPLRRVKPDVPRGKVFKTQITHPFIMVGGKRDVWLYQPPTDQPTPLLVVYDGRDYLRRGKLTEIVDNLIAQGKIRPVALAMVDNAGQGRFVEYNASEATLLYVTSLLLPLAASELRLLDVTTHPGAYGVMGASMGGLMALHTGLRLPHIFGRVLAQAGAFQMGLTPMGPGSTKEALAEALVKHAPPAPLTIWQDVGSFDWLVALNRVMHALLVEKGYTVAYREYSAGHNYPAWRDALPEALMHLFGT